MIFLTLVLVLLYIFHVLYGPHFYRNSIHQWKLASLSRTCKRLFYLTNLCFVALALLNTYPSNKLLTLTLVLILSSVFGYWRFLVLEDHYPFKYILDHIILFVPLVAISYHNKLQLEWTLSKPIVLTLVVLTCYSLVYTKIYL